jgi:hypothetical protein
MSQEVEVIYRVPPSLGSATHTTPATIRGRAIMAPRPSKVALLFGREAHAAHAQATLGTDVAIAEKARVTRNFSTERELGTRTRVAAF